MDKKKLVLILLFLIALGLTSYPLFLRVLYHRQAEECITQFEQVVSVPISVDVDGADNPPAADDSPAVDEHDELLAAMEQYNRDIWHSQQSDFDSVEDYETPAVDAALYLGTDTVGIIYIPAMDVELPLYLGASKANMAKGAVVLGGTSCPIGGVNTNCVIAGHRGYSGIPYFREIQRLSVGDCVSQTSHPETAPNEPLPATNASIAATSTGKEAMKSEKSAAIRCSGNGNACSRISQNCCKYAKAC